MITEHLCHRLHRFEPGAHGPCAPFIEEPACPIGGEILPEALEVLLDQIGPNRFEVAFEQVRQPVHLVIGQIFRPFQQAPPASCQHGFFPLGLDLLGFLGSDFINGFVHVAHYMEPVENIDCAGSHLGDYAQIGLPHITANESQASASLSAKPLEKTPESFGSAISAYPKQSSLSGIELIDERNELLFALSPANLVSADGLDTFEITMSEPPFHCHLDRPEDILPSCLKGPCNLQPGKTLCPRGKEPRICGGQVSFPLGPGNPLNLDAAIQAVDPPHGIEEEYGDAPQGNEFKATLGLCVIAWPGFTTTGTDWPAVFAGSDFYFQCQSSCVLAQLDRTINKTFVQLDPVQYSFDMHPVAPLLAMDFFVDLHYAKMVNGMLYFQAPSGETLSLTICSSALTGTHRFC